jgi:hypothetical protein
MRSISAAIAAVFAAFMAERVMALIIEPQQLFIDRIILPH